MRRLRNITLLMLALLALVSTASAQLSSSDIDALRDQGAEEGWTFSVGKNPATDRSFDELCGLVVPPNWAAGARFDPITATVAQPDYYNWCDLGGCTAIKDQAACGSCWAFATVGPLESAILIMDGVEVDLSEQWLVSCNSDGWSCSGGWWAHDYHEWKTDPCGGTGAVTESDFPYTASNAPCNCPYPHSYMIDSWAYVGGSGSVPSVESIKQAIMDYGPVSVAIYVESAFRAYTSGVFNTSTPGTVNHGVVLVGWDDNQGTNGVWFLRNSWGSDWGESGYMRIEYNCSNVGYAASYVDYPGGDDLQVTPTSGFTSIGPEGGPFSPPCQTYTLTNIGADPLDWETEHTEVWLDVTPSSGTLASGALTDVEVCINSNADTLPTGMYEDIVTLINVTSGNTLTRRVTLRVGQIDYFTELFDSSDNDLDNQTLTLTPNGSASFYRACREEAFDFPTDPTGGTTLPLSDDDYEPVFLTGGQAWLYGTSYSSFHVGSNGYITFTGGDTDYTESLTDHFDTPRISALFDDLNPSSGGTVSALELEDRAVVTYENVPEYGTGGSNSFQIEMFFDGTIRITHLALSATDGVAGISEGNGVPPDFLESDLSTYDPCCVDMPDLTVESFSLAGPPRAAPGEAIGSRMAAVVENIGEVDATAFFVGFYLSDDPEITTADTLLVSGRESVSGVPAGGSVPVTILPGMAVPSGYPIGSAYLGVIVDDLEDIDECGELNNTASMPLEISSEPDAEFSGEPRSGCVPLETCFTDLSSGSPTSWSWDFGDGGTSTEQNPCHIYVAPGVYTVSLTVTNAYGPDTETKADYIVVYDLPVADFEGTPLAGFVPLTVNFTDLSSGVPTSWWWDFGDGSTSTDQDPIHTYIDPGLYTVTLTVSNLCGSDIETKTDYVVVEWGGTPPVAYDGYATTDVDIPVTTALEATDEGLPDPPGVLDQIVTALATHGTLSDPLGGVITTVPYTLIDYGNELIYTPDSGYAGTDFFQFKANDGGTAPWGGDSNTATVTITVEACLPPPVPTDPDPADGAEDVPRDTLLSWNAGAGCAIIDDFEDGNISEYTMLPGATHFVSSAAAHDGDFGLEDSNPLSSAGWIYRDDPAAQVAQGDTISYWTQLLSDEFLGRSYCGFGASSAGTYSLIAAPNTGQLIIQLNSGYSYSDIAAVSQTWTPNKWYRLEVQWDVGGTITGRLYDSDGTTLLNTVTGSNSAYTQGGIALRGFDHVYQDTIERCGPSGLLTAVPVAVYPSGWKAVAPPDPADAIGWDNDNDALIFAGSSRELTQKAGAEANVGESTLSDALGTGYAMVDGTVVAVTELELESQPQRSRAAPTVGIPMVDTIGSQSTPATYSARIKGNFFACTSATTLIESEFYLSIPSSTELRFFVYEALTQTSDTFTLISDIVVPSSGIGEGFYSSGPISVPLVAGKYYAIGVGWAGTATYWYDTGHPTTVAFGESYNGLAHVTYPPPATVDHRNDLAQYYQRLTTDSDVEPCPTTYDVYLNGELVCSDISETICDPGPLEPLTPYSWQVIARNCCGETPGPVWSFITGTEGPVPDADFEGWPQEGCLSLVVDFTDLSVDNGSPITSWSWDFGDSGTSTVQNPTHTYAAPGVYTVSLTVTNTYGPDTETKADYIVVYDFPVADFEGTPTVGFAPLTVNFTDLSSGVPTSWWWDFGDGGTSTDQNPIHTYTDPGLYTVTLTVSNLCDSDIETKTDYVVVEWGGTPPAAYDGYATTDVDTSVKTTLEATDEGLPDPPGVLNQIVTALAMYGTLSDPLGGVINAVPYTLIDHGYEVIYTPGSGYEGTDFFQFKANDGGASPWGGDSNTATLTITVEACLPPVPTAPDPANGAEDVLLDTLLSWGEGASWYSEDFEDGLAQDWDEDVDADWNVSAGEYVAYTPSPPESMSMVATYSGQVFDDCRYEVDMRRGEEFTYARYMLIRATEDWESSPVSTGSGYFLGLDEVEYSIRKQEEGVVTTLQAWTYSPYLNGPTEWNTLAVNVIGSSLELYINGNLVWSGTDPDLTSGRIGLLGFTGPSYINTHYFDNVTVGPPITLSATIGAEQQWYNEYPAEGGTPESAPAEWKPPTYPGGAQTVISVTSGDIDVTTDEPFEVAPHRYLSPRKPVTAGGAVLWDLTHGVYLNYQPSGSFSSLVSVLEGKGFTVDTTDAGVDTIDLSAYDVLVACLGSAWSSVYSPSEVAAIETFVNGGGGLLVMGENTDCPNPNVNPVAQDFGITCGVSYLSPADLYFTDFAAHPIFDGCSEINYPAAGELTAVPPGELVAWSDGGLGTVAVASPLGRVVVTGDFNFCDNSRIGESDNQLFAENIFDWIAQASECPTTYDVYLNGELIWSDISERVCDPGILELSTTYEWQVIARTCCGETPGPVWSFTTCSLPSEPADPSPPDGATDVPVDTDLAWNGGGVMLRLGEIGGAPATLMQSTRNSTLLLDNVYPAVSAPRAAPSQALNRGLIEYDAEDLKSRGLLDDAGMLIGVEREVGNPQAQAESGLSVLFFDPQLYETYGRVAALGYDVTRTTNVGDLTRSNLENYDVLWVEIGADPAGYESQAGEIQEWVSLDGGGFLVVQPNITGAEVTAFPPGYEVTIYSSGYPGGYVATIVDPSHPIVSGLSDADLPGDFERVRNVDIGGAWDIIAVSVPRPGDIALLAGEYGAGRLGFCTGALAPSAADPGSDQFVIQMVDWVGSGSSACTTTYDVYLNGELVCSDISECTCDPGPLEPMTSYSWQVIARNCCGETPGPVWSFITGTDGQLPVADFEATPLEDCAPLVVDFMDLSVDNGSPITSWSWDFGDGSTSTVQHPTHTYVAPGVYDVSLTVTNAYGPDTETKADYIVVLDLPVADFEATPQEGCAPLEVCFTDLSTGDIDTWWWDFGDGVTSTEFNPCHTYVAPGVYTVSLTVSGPCGADVATKVDYITVWDVPVADFEAHSTIGPAPLFVEFTDLSVDNGAPITSWSWDFGDGGTSPEQDPTHTYVAPDVYTVALTVTNACGSDTETKVDYITVTPADFVHVVSLDPSEFPTITAGVFVDTEAGRNCELLPEDFVVTEDGILQVLESVTCAATGSMVADIVLVFDDTGSMGGEIAAMKAEASSFANEIIAAGVDAQFGLVSFGDTAEVDLLLTAEVAAFQAAIDALYATGGGDGPEVSLDAVMLGLSTMPFRAGAQKIFVLITDAPTHYRGDGTTYSSYTMPEVVDAVNAAAATVFAVSPDYGAGASVQDNEGNDLGMLLADPNETDVRVLAEETGGIWLDIYGADFSLIVDEIVTAITSLWTLVYITDNPAFDGTTRLVCVTVTDPVEGVDDDCSTYTAPLDAECEMVELLVGYNPIGFCGDYSSYMAQDVLDEINSQGGCAVEIYRWLPDLGRWDVHVDGLPFNNFAIDNTQGYILRCECESTWTQQCLPETPSPLVYPLVSGYNFISYPRWAADSEGLYLAQDVCDSIDSQGGCAVEIYRYLTELGRWDVHVSGLPFNNFDVECSRGYMVRCSCDSDWELSNEVLVTDITDNSFTVSWTSDTDATGWIILNPGTPDEQIVYDAGGAGIVDDTHYVSVGGLGLRMAPLAAEMTYYFDVVTGGVVDDNGGSHYAATTGPLLSIAPIDAAYGQVFESDGTTPAARAIVYIELQDDDGAGSPGNSSMLSALTDADGWWWRNVGDVRLPDLTDYFTYSATGDLEHQTAEGAASGTASQIVDTGGDDPSPAMTLGP